MTDVRRPRAPSCVKCARPDHSRPRRRSNKLGGCGRAKKLLAGAGGADHADTARPAAADGSRPPGPSSPRASSGGAAAARSADQRQPQLSPVSRTCTSASLSSLCAANAPAIPHPAALRSGRPGGRTASWSRSMGEDIPAQSSRRWTDSSRRAVLSSARPLGRRMDGAGLCAGSGLRSRAAASSRWRPSAAASARRVSALGLGCEVRCLAAPPLHRSLVHSGRAAVARNG